MTIDTKAAREIVRGASRGKCVKHKLSVNTIDLPCGGTITVLHKTHPDDENDRDVRESLEADTVYTAYARNTLPTLLDELDTLRRKVEGAKENLRRIIRHVEEHRRTMESGGAKLRLVADSIARSALAAMEGEGNG